MKRLKNGVETVTESSNPEIAAKIQEHVHWMKVRVDETKPIRMRDPLFAEIFRHADKIEMTYEETEGGVRVTETSKDPYVVTLIQAHADVVSGFVKQGFAEAMKNHAVPGTSHGPRQVSAPVIQEHGEVTQFPGAAHQPRSGSRICVDITAGSSDPAELNPAFEKVARYVNIYAGAGAEPAQAHIALVLHGDATLAVLHHEAYGKKFGTESNPHLPLLHELHEAGVEIYVCGQSLTKKGGKPEDLVVFCDMSFSALTALVNLQSDGYAYVPLLK